MSCVGMEMAYQSEHNGGAGIYKNATENTLWASPDSLATVPHNYYVQMSMSKAQLKDELVVH